ncbi:MAG TPA: thioesterase family protein [Solirubrobacteraceae bacterium]|nr:thioesterase family protein [Solirubrobacteraceae bacterium]
MSESIFVLEGEHFIPTEHARGPWDPQALHGGAPAALMTAAFERVQPGAELLIGRLGFELLRPIPFAPLSISTAIVRPGRRVQELAGELRSGEELICRASALRVQRIPDDLPRVPAAPSVPPAPGGRAAGEPGAAPDPANAAAASVDGAMPGPETGTAVRFALNGSDDASFAASAMEMRWLSDPSPLGPARVWMRLRHPLVGQELPTGLARLAATADFGNGVSAELPFERYLFINADLTIHLQRHPVGEWIGLDARTLLSGGGAGLSESVLHDVHGPVGRAFQTLVVQAR